MSLQVASEAIVSNVWEFQTSCSRSSLGEDGILRVSVQGPQQLADARAWFEGAAQRVKKKPAPVLLDMRESAGVEPDAQAFYSKPEMKQVTTKVAILTDSLVGRTFGNLYLIFNRPAVSTRLFGNRADATRWLKQA